MQVLDVTRQLTESQSFVQERMGVMKYYIFGTFYGCNCTSSVSQSPPASTVAY